MTIKSSYGLTLVAIAVSALAVGSTSVRAQEFDAKKFFDRLELEGNKAPADFSPKAFFDKLAAEGNSATHKIDAKTFFDKLAAEGNRMPGDFDPKKFFDKLAAEGNANMMPPMVEKPKN